MLPRVPVSRKRKKKTSGSSGRPSGRSRSPMSQPGSGVAAPARDDRELARAFQGLAAYRDQIHRQRESRAATMATDLVADLARAVVDQPDIVVSDALCERLGGLLAEDERSPLDVRVSPDHLAEATLAAAEASVEAALPATTEQADAWRGSWRVLTALTAVLPYPFPDAIDETITRLRALPTGRVLPTVPPGPEVTGPVLWTSDRYNSRFAVTASIMTAEEPVRWYLWDIDVCGHEAFTVHSRYHPHPPRRSRTGRPEWARPRRPGPSWHRWMTRGCWPTCCQPRWGSCVPAGRTSSSSPSTTAASGWPRPSTRPSNGQCPDRTRDQTPV